MAEPEEWRIIEAVAALMSGMTGVRPWGGQYPSDPLVQHHYEEPRAIDAFLRIRVREASGSSSRIGSIKTNDVENDFRVRIDATIVGNIEVPVQAWAQRVKQDMRKTVMAGLSLGGLVSGFSDNITYGVTEAEGDSVEFPQQATVSMFVTYRFR